MQIEPPRKKNEVVQCTRCQRYGHTKTYCRRQHRCVKCGQEHNTKQCTKTKDTPAICVLCEGNHTANYKGCPVYKDIIDKKEANTQRSHWHRTRSDNVPNTNAPQYTTPISRSIQNTEAVGDPTTNYARVLSPRAIANARHSNYNQNNNNATENPNNNNNADIILIFEKSFNEFKEVIRQQNVLLNNMLTLLTTVVQSLPPRNV